MVVRVLEGKNFDEIVSIFEPCDFLSIINIIGKRPILLIIKFSVPLHEQRIRL